MVRWQPLLLALFVASAGVYAADKEDATTLKVTEATTTVTPTTTTAEATSTVSETTTSTTTSTTTEGVRQEVSMFPVYLPKNMSATPQNSVACLL